MEQLGLRGYAELLDLRLTGYLDPVADEGEEEELAPYTHLGIKSLAIDDEYQDDPSTSIKESIHKFPNLSTLIIFEILG